MTTGSDPRAAKDLILAKLHELCGYCGHCGKKRCLGKKEHSRLPERVNLADVLAAINAGLPDD